MVDLVAKIVWYKIGEIGHHVDSVSDVNEWLWGDAPGKTQKMDPLGLLLLGWIVLAGVVYFSTDHIKALLAKFLGEPEALQGNRGPVAKPLRKESSFKSIRSNSPPRPTSAVYHDNPWERRASENQTFFGQSGTSAPTESLQARVKLINYSQEGSDWVNNVLNWLYHRYNTTPEFADIWLSGLNEYAKRNAQQLGILVTFDRFLPASKAPKVGDVRAELSADEQLSIFCSLETIQLGFAVLATITTDSTGIVITDNYEADIDHLQGEVRFLNINDMRSMQPGQHQTQQCFQLAMKIYTNPQNEIMLAAEFEKQPPNIKVTARPIGTNAYNQDFDPTMLQEAIKKCILNAKINIKLARFRDFPPPYWQISKPSSPSVEAAEPVQADFPFTTNATKSAPSKVSPFGPGQHQVVVNVIRAEGIGGNTGATEPYCVIEMDEPPQKHTTSIVKSNGANPVWDETFYFDLSPDSHEILFEVYDKTKTQQRNFLGTAIVSLHELGKNPKQKQVTSLQSRPLMNDSVSGTLALEFTVIPAGSTVQPPSRDLSARTSPSKSSTTLPSKRNSHIFLEETVRSHPAGASAEERARKPYIQRSVSEDISIHRVTTVTTNNVIKRNSSTMEGLVPADGSSGFTDADSKGRARSADRKPSLFGRIKRRFSFGKKRSKSLDPVNAKAEMMASTSTPMINGPVDRVTDPMDGDPEVIAAERLANSRKGHTRSRSAPGTREPSATRSTASNKPQGSWRDKFRSRFSRKKSQEPRIITTQEIL